MGMGVGGMSQFSHMSGSMMPGAAANNIAVNMGMTRQAQQFPMPSDYGLVSNAPKLSLFSNSKIST